MRVGVGVDVRVEVGVAVRVCASMSAGSGDAVAVAVAGGSVPVAVGAVVGVAVGVLVDVRVGVRVAVLVGVEVLVLVGIGVGEEVGDDVLVAVGIDVAVSVGTLVAVDVGGTRRVSRRARRSHRRLGGLRCRRRRVVVGPLWWARQARCRRRGHGVLVAVGSGVFVSVGSRCRRRGDGRFSGREAGAAVSSGSRRHGVRRGGGGTAVSVTVAVGIAVRFVAVGTACLWQSRLGIAVFVGVAVGAAPSTAVFMSDTISGALSPRLYTRTSSITPLKYSPQMRVPADAQLVTRRVQRPARRRARYLHAVDVHAHLRAVERRCHVRPRVVRELRRPRASQSPVVLTTPMFGRFVSVFAYIVYTSRSLHDPCGTGVLADSFITSVRQPLIALGFTHASSVRPVVASSDALSGTRTRLLVPLNESPLPYFPATRVAPTSVPVLLKPDASAVVAPDVSLKPYAATRPGVAARASCERHSAERERDGDDGEGYAENCDAA